MKVLLVVLTMFGLIDTAFANQNTQVDNVRVIRARDYSCNQIQAWVAHDGVIYIQSWIGGNYYYANGLSCGHGYIPVAGWVRASDKLCHAGYICRINRGSDDD